MQEMVLNCNFCLHCTKPYNSAIVEYQASHIQKSQVQPQGLTLSFSHENQFSINVRNVVNVKLLNTYLLLTDKISICCLQMYKIYRVCCQSLSDHPCDALATLCGHERKKFFIIDLTTKHIK